MSLILFEALGCLLILWTRKLSGQKSDSRPSSPPNTLEHKSSICSSPLSRKNGIKVDCVHTYIRSKRQDGNELLLAWVADD